jgi:hypothetical protein
MGQPISVHDFEFMGQRLTEKEIKNVQNIQLGIYTVSLGMVISILTYTLIYGS